MFIEFIPVYVFILLICKKLKKIKVFKPISSFIYIKKSISNYTKNSLKWAGSIKKIKVI